mgnify:CR=1 FL=1
MSGYQWNRRDLLNCMSVFGAPRHEVEQRDVPAAALVAWRLQAASQPNLSAPGMFAARRAVQDPVGAGELFNDLADLGPEALAAVMYWAQIGGVEECPAALRQMTLEFRQAVGKRVLPDALGLRRLYRALAEAHGGRQERSLNRYDGYLKCSVPLSE